MSPVTFLGKILTAFRILRTEGILQLFVVILQKLQHSARLKYEARYQALPTPESPSQRIEEFRSYDDQLFSDVLVIIAGVPMDDVGGGQRSAQLARTAIRHGLKVIYLYTFEKYDFSKKSVVSSNITQEGLLHLEISQVDPSEVLDMVGKRGHLLIELPTLKSLEYLELFKDNNHRVTFELIDDWDTSLGSGWYDDEVLKKIVLRASTVTGTAKILVNRLKNLGRSDALYLPNAGDETIFNFYQDYEKPSDIPKDYRHVGVYFGSLYGDWFAWSYIKKAAIENSDTAFLLIGSSPRRTDMPKNVFFLGEKDIAALPGYLKFSNFTLLPFLPGKISDAVSPIKVFEYLLMNQPVVSTILPELQDYPNIYPSGNETEFAENIRKIKDRNLTPQSFEGFCLSNTWNNRLDIILRRELDCQRAISVIILIHNNQDIIGRLLDSLYINCNDLIHEIIVVDNLSLDLGVDFVLKHFPNVRLIKNSVNGCSSGRNLAVEIATGEYLLFLDSDQFLTSRLGLIEGLEILSSNKTVGAVGWAAGWFSSKNSGSGPIAEYIPAKAMKSRWVTKGYRTDVGYLGTGGLLCSTRIFKHYWKFDENYDPTCFEDTDLSFQMKKAGFDLAYRRLSGIIHEAHQTTQPSLRRVEYRTNFERNQKYFLDKWKRFPNFFTTYRH